MTTASLAAQRIIENATRIVPIVCPMCGETVARAVNGSTTMCNRCGVWAFSRPDLERKK